MNLLLAQTEEDVNQSAIDRHTWGHIGFGLMLGMIRVNPVYVFWGLVVWELLEGTIRERYPGLMPDTAVVEESTINRVTDVLAGFTGYALGRGV